MSNPKQKKRLPLWSRPGYLIRRVHQIHLALFVEELKASGLTPVQYGLLTALIERGALDQVSVAAEVGLERTTAAEVLTRLEKRKLVGRKPSPHDGRAKLVGITRRGRALMAATHGAMLRSQDRLCEPLTPKQRRDFIAALIHLIEVHDIG
jgi:DNA-binding MarR family transcriptional regulator